ncbi:MAG TPA: PRC-barrel domain-containing protein [Anaerolineae bacterium]|nr:PRC-barrel domain-containing protein [Anaerolineae bacterium]
MQFTQGANVVTAQGQDVGNIDRVVIDPRSKEVTHIVVRKGLLSTQDKVVPIDLIAAATADRITLREDAADPQALPDFEEEYYVASGEDGAPPDPPLGSLPGLYWYPPVAGGQIGYLFERSRQAPITQIQRNIPEGMVALKEGAKVISADDRYVGKIERVLIDPQADRATHFLISKGLLLKETKIVPVQWVTNIGEDEVHLAVRSRLLNELRAHREPEPVD